MKDKKKVSYIIIGIICMIITITGTTFAYLAISATSSNSINGTVASVGLVLGVNKVTPETNGTDNLIPQLETALGTAISNEHKCIDANNNTVCQVYKVSVTNNSSATVKVTGTITFNNISTIPHLKWKQITNATTVGTSTGVAATTTPADFVTDVTLTNNQTEDFYLVVWIDETGNIQNESGTFSGTISFTDSNGTGVTSTIGATNQTPTSPENYVVSFTTMRIGQPLPNGITLKTAALAKADWVSIAGSEKPFYLKHTLNGSNISESYVCFERNSTEYCLKGGDSGASYLSNAKIIYDAFEGSGCSGDDNLPATYDSS